MTETYLLEACLYSGQEGSLFFGMSASGSLLELFVPCASSIIESAIASGTSHMVWGLSCCVGSTAGSLAFGISLALVNRGVATAGLVELAAVAAFLVRLGLTSASSVTGSVFFFAADFVDAAALSSSQPQGSRFRVPMHRLLLQPSSSLVF